MEPKTPRSRFDESSGAIRDVAVGVDFVRSPTSWHKSGTSLKTELPWRLTVEYLNYLRR
jgi:hypothetical protein